MRYGSLFSGVDGLGLAVEAVFDASTAWHAECDPHASTVLALRWPGVPNYGDVGAVEWSEVEPVDIICGGPPCQPFSSAGRRLGVSDDRWHWPDFARAVRALRPRWVVIENVAAITADACAFGWIVGDLAEAGYDAAWGCLRASNVGAPHRRGRLFLLAQDASSGGLAGEAARDQVGRAVAIRSAGGAGGPSGGPPADADRHLLARTGAGDIPATAGAGEGGDRQRQRVWTVAGHGGEAAADTHGLEGSESQPLGDDGRGPWGGDWGPYALAIERWARLLGRPVPAPVDDRGRLNPHLSEWMMGVPEGWVTDAPIPVTAMHRCIGNSVVPQCAEAAIRQLVGVLSEREAAA